MTYRVHMHNVFFFCFSLYAPRQSLHPTGNCVALCHGIVPFYLLVAATNEPTDCKIMKIYNAIYFANILSTSTRGWRTSDAESAICWALLQGENVKWRGFFYYFLAILNCHLLYPLQFGTLDLLIVHLFM